MTSFRFLRASMAAALLATLGSPLLAHAQEGRAVSLGDTPRPPGPAQASARFATPAPLAPRSRALAVTFEALSPVGGAGCFYRRLYVPGAFVTAGSLIGGGSLLYMLATNNRDGAIINAVAYGVSRLIGIVTAARPEPTEPPIASALQPDPPPRAALLPGAVRSVGLSHAFSF